MPTPSQTTKTYLQHKEINLLLSAQSPSLNVIENVWKLIKSKLNFDPRRPLTTRSELIL